MTSKEALKEYKEIYIDKTFKGNECPSQEWYFKIIKQDLDRLEKLESEVKRKSDIICMLESEIESLHTEIESLQSENKKLNKQLDVFFNKLDKNTIRALDLISYDLYDENSKLKKVIEIIKTKTVFLVILRLSKDLNDYNIMTHFDENITQEEYDLLKEYLK